MKKILNKKGFTLVELLAVIVILAVIILVAMNAVIPQMEQARRSAFATEIQTFSKAAETYFTKKAMIDASVLSGNSCVKVATLKNEYVKKSDAKYLGVACINNNNIYLTLTSGEFQYNGQVTGMEESAIEAKIIKVPSSDAVGDQTLPTCEKAADGKLINCKNEATFASNDIKE